GSSTTARACWGRGRWRERLLRDDFDHLDGPVQPLQAYPLAGVKRHSRDVLCQMDDYLAGQDLAGERDAAQPGRQVQRAAAVSTLGGHRLAGIKAHPDAERDHRLSVHAFEEPALQLD